MALVLRPHSATYKAPSAVTATLGTTTGVIVGGKHPTTTATILGQLDELTAREAFERYGIEEERAGVWMCNPADGDGISLEGKLIIDGSTWMVRAKKRIAHGLALDHWEIMVVRVYG
jgi:hypothetical protein